MKKIVYFFIIFLLLTSCTSPKYKDLKDGIYANIETNKGDILLELYANDVPKTVANFISLVEGTNTRLLDSLKGKNFYEGVIFHRVVPNFVIQAGGYTSKGRKIAGYLFGDEFPISDNGDYIYKHDDQGILSMANGGPKTNNSQFFITHRAIPHLNGKHSVFGKTTVNSLELKELQKKYTDSLQLKKAIDSARMVIVNKIVQNDTINTIKIIRIGVAAKEFDAASVFNEEEADFEKSQQAKIIQENKREEKRYAKYLVRKKAFLAKMDVSKAKETGTGLRILMLKETKGKKVTENKPITANYTLYIADGKRMQSSSDVGKPVVFNLKDEQNPMISGLREGLLTMREGEKARFFIPYSIAFGDQKAGPFPAKSDLIYEIEILKIGK